MNFDEMEILSEEQFDSLGLFEEGAEEQTGGEQEAAEERVPEGGQEHNEPAAEEVDPEHLFEEEETPESVGAEKNGNKNGGGTPSGQGNPPHILSSLAKALKEEGILAGLDDETIAQISDSASLASAIDKEVHSRLDAQQQRVKSALENGVEPSAIANYENTIRQLDSITEAQVTADNEAGENLRKQIIFRDFLNRGYSEERAQREVDKSFNSGTDIEDAKDALEGIKEAVRAQYNKVLEDAKAQEDEVKTTLNKQAETLRKSLLEDKSFFNELELDKTTRQTVIDNLVKPIYTDPETGKKYSAVQKFEKDNRVDFLKYVGICFTLTDGFKNLDGLVKGKVKKEMGKGMREFESVVNNTQRNPDGTLNFAAGTKDTESFFKDFTLLS